MKPNQFILPILLILNCLQVSGQRENDIWYFGLNAALDFRSGIPIAIPGSEMRSIEGSASICNAAGELLFFTNGKKVWDKNNEVMPNGSGLLGGLATSSTHQALIVPIPENPSLYYIFTTDERARNNGIRYSQVDMRLNEGLGDITSKNEYKVKKYLDRFDKVEKRIQEIGGEIKVNSNINNGTSIILIYKPNAV